MNTVTTYYSLGNAYFTLGQLITVVLMILGALALTFLLRDLFVWAFLRGKKRWDNRPSLQRKLSRWDCVRPRARQA